MDKIVIDLTKTESKLTFKNVEVNMFFENKYGEVCQKYSNSSYNTLCTKSGKNLAYRYDNVSPGETISKILDITFKR